MQIQKRAFSIEPVTSMCLAAGKKPSTFSSPNECLSGEKHFQIGYRAGPV